MVKTTEPQVQKKRTYKNLHASNRPTPVVKGRPLAVKSVKFDEEARREFLTGFSKRKKEKLEARKKRHEKVEREERNKLRAELREQRKKRLEETIELGKQLYGDGGGSDGSDEIQGGSGLKQEITFDDSDAEMETKVVVEEFDPIKEQEEAEERERKRRKALQNQTKNNGDSNRPPTSNTRKRKDWPKRRGK